MMTYELTPSQLQIWKSQAISPRQPLFNQIVTARLNLPDASAATRQAVLAAWRQTQQIHRVLGSTIVADDNMQPRQQFNDAVHEMEQVDLDTVSMQEAGAKRSDKALSRWISQRGSTVFQLDKQLTDAVLLHLGNQQLMVYLNMHHLIADALSTQWVLHTLIKALERQHPSAGIASEPQAADNAIRPFSDFALHVSENSHTADIKRDTNEPPETIEKALSVESTTPETALQTALQTPPAFYGVVNTHPNTESKRMRLDIGDDDLAKINLLAADPALRQFNNNLFLMCFHTSALALYLYKCTGESNLVIEAPLSGRFDARWKRTVGNLIEMVRIEIDVSASDTLLALYQHVRSRVLETLQRAHTGCTRELKPGRVHGVINMITGHASPNSALMGELQWHHSGHSDTHHPLRLHIADWEKTGKHTIDIDLNLNFLPEPYTEAACRHLKLAYQALISNRDTSIDRICLVAETEIWRLHGPTASIKPVPFRSLVDWFDDVGRDFPGKVAICDETDRLSYAAVRQQSLRVADFLYRHGLGGQRKVAVLMRRGIELPVILLGILRSNSVLIPLDYNQPAERIRDIIRDAQADCIIVDTLCKHDFQDCTTAFTAEHVLDEHDATDAQPDTRQTPSQAQLQSPENSNASAINPIEPVNTVIPGNQTDQTQTPPIQATDTAYIIFTSGSTGKPKGVVVSHGALNAYLGWAAGYYKLQEPHEPIVMPLHTSIGFDMTVTSLFLPITSGGMLKVFSEAEATPQANALSLLQVMSDPELNTVKLTPSHIALLEGIQSPSTSIKQLIVGGEDLKNNAARYAYELFEKNIRIINEYGPSEATVGCITQDWNEQFDCLSVPIGLPINGMSAYVLDEHQLPQFEGMPGELYLSGQSLADGYWRNDRDTERSFIDNPWDTNGRMYRTGDLVRVENQRLVYLGRKDTQIKRSGYRIELSEIESTLAMHPEVKDCAVVFESSTRAPHGNAYTSDNETHCKLCGLSSRHPQGALNNDELCEICASYLPNKARINEYFRNNDELATLVENIKRNATGNYDAVVLLSGGKDSTYSIARLVDMGLKVYAFSLDNGFISDQAKDNINRVCKTLDIDHVYGTTQHMNDIFVDSLNRYSNVCHGCFKTIYTLAMQFAEEQGINTIFTGLSRGQLFETRLNNELFADNSLPLVKIDEMVQSARLQYHAFPDAANRLLAVDSVNSGVLPEKIDIVDFYRYCHVELSDMMHYLKTRVGWVRPPDTGRSTNCLINDVGIHVHAIEQGFHNYSLPYSWDVRLGHKQRDEALEELDDDIDIARVNTILNTIGYQPVNKVSAPDALVAFVASSDNLGREELLTWASTRLPFYMQPDSIEFIHSMPLNANGKIDRKRLAPDEKSSEEKPPNINLSSFEQSVADIWQPYLTTELTHKESNFFKSGGDSLSAIRCVVALRKIGYAIEPADLFRNPTLQAFTALLESSDNKISDTSTVNTSKFSTLNQKQQEKLQKILGKNRSNP